MNCAHCGQPARYIQQYGQWWCDGCQQYTQGPAPAGVPAAGASAQAAGAKSSLGGKVLKIFGVLFIVAVGLLIGGYFLNKKQAEVYVSCDGKPDGSNLLCKVEHQEGGATAEACFDVQLTCGNDSTVKTNRCVTVDPDKTEITTFTDTDFGEIGNCSLPLKGIEPLNLKLTAR